MPFDVIDFEFAKSELMARAGGQATPQWRALLAGSEAAPEPRSGHAMTLLQPTASALLFGGSDGDIFFNDFYVLEPATFARESQDSQHDSAAPLSLELSAIGDLAGLSQSSTASSSSRSSSDARPPPLPELAWKRLVVTYAPYRHQQHLPDAPTSSSQDDNDELSYVGGGRDYHSMHYVPTSRDEERRLGLRVLVLGNILVSTESDAKSFETDEFRVEEVRVHQPMLEAQWAPRRLRNNWKPRARQGHCSVVRV